jgi:hypothetical protein
MKTEKKSKIIEIKEEIAIEQDDKKIILEKGDKIEILKDNFQEEIDINKIVKDAHLGSDVYSLVNRGNRLIPKNVYSKFTKESWNPIDAMSLAMGDLLRGMIDEFFERFTSEEVAIILKKSKAQWNGILDKVAGDYNIRM